MSTSSLSSFSLARSGLALALAASLALLAFAFTTQTARADQDPAGCTGAGFTLNFDVYSDAGGTIPATSVIAGQTIYYRAVLEKAGGANCNFGGEIGNSLSLTLPNGSAAPGSPFVIPLVTATTSFSTSLISYVVDSADVGTNGAPANHVRGIATFTATSHRNPHQTIGGNSNIDSPFEKLDPGITTEVHDPAHVDITNGSVGQGTPVHDKVILTASSTGPVPTGTADLTLHAGLICQGTVLGTENDVALVAGVAESTPTAPAPGDYSYSVHYDGDDNYNEATATCEPFTIDAVLPLDVVKTSRTAHEKSWDWSIVKSASTTNLLLAEGESYTLDYTIDVSATLTEVIDESGTIAITNPVGNPSATIESVTDTFSIDGAATVTCPGVFPQVLAPGATLNCTYQKTPSAAVDQENTATVTTSGSVPGGSDTVPVTFAPATLIDECVNVTDTYAEGPQNVQVCAGDGDDDETFNYSVTFGPDGGQGVDVPVACGANTHPNTASFLVVNDENDTAEADDSSWNVEVIVECVRGCTLTQGYWKTHSDQGPAPFDDGWDLLPSGLAEATPFFGSGKTWYEAFWTPVAGRPYYQLAHQYMAAVLNVLNGATPTAAVTQAFADAEALFTNPLYDTPAEIDALKGKNANSIRQQFTSIAGILGSYNEGLTGPGHCDEQNPI